MKSEVLLTQDIIKETKVDVIICNYDLHTIDYSICPIIRLSNIPSITDWSIARDVIQRLMR